MLSKKIFDDLIKDCPCGNHGLEEEWCFFRAVVMSMEDRMTEQRRLVVDYQYMCYKGEGSVLNMETAFTEFTNKGYARKFGEVYKDGMTREELFPLVFGVSMEMPRDKEIEEHITK
jgi:hypothetical protein